MYRVFLNMCEYTEVIYNLVKMTCKTLNLGRLERYKYIA
jgi:hypothetical protein